MDVNLWIVVFALACLGCALFFAVDYGRMKRQRDDIAERLRYAQAYRDTLFADILAQHLSVRPARDPVTGRYRKRAK